MAKAKRGASAGGRGRKKSTSSAGKKGGRGETPSQFASEEEAILFDDFRRKQVPIRPAHKVADVVSQLLTKRGYANIQTKLELEEAWKEAAGASLASHTRPGLISRGCWEIFVKNSTLLQELSFQQTAILRAIQAKLPQHKIARLRFRVGAVG